MVSNRDTRLQAIMRSYGEKIARRHESWFLATLLICFLIASPGWHTRKFFGGQQDFLSPVPLELQWSVSGGKTERNIKLWKENHGDLGENPWAMKSHVTQLLGKGNNEGKDILTRDALMEWVELDRKWTNLSVEVRGKTYTTWDICARGILPDIPGMPTMPCLSVSPLHCFREEGEVNHDSYKAIDPIVDQLIPGAVPYSTRPSLATLTDAEIKSYVSALPDATRTGPPGATRGCLGQFAQAVYTADLWGGGFVWNHDGTLTKSDALRGIYYMDGPERVAYRMSIMKPSHAKLADIKEAQRKHSALWQRICLEHNRKNKHLEVANLEDVSYITDMYEEESNQMKWGYFISGGVLMFLFCSLVLASCRHPMASRADVGFRGLTVVLISQITSFGLYFLCGMYLNPSMMLAMPLLALGLGVDDMFVLLRYFSDLGCEFIDGHNYGEIIGEVLAQAGPGITLTSVCNTLVFACGIFLPIPAMSDFCMLAAFIAIVNYLCMINLFLPLLVFEASRVKAKKPELQLLTYFCQRMIMKQDEAQSLAVEMNERRNGAGSASTNVDRRRLSKDATSSQGFSRHPEKYFVQWLVRWYAPFIMKPIVAFTVAVLAIAGLTCSCIFIRDKAVGYSIAELFPKQDPNYRAVLLAFEKFTLFPANLVFFDVDIAERQADMLQLYKDLGNTQYAMPGFLPPYLTLFYLSKYMEAVATHPEGTDLVTITESVGFDTTWTEPSLAPFGTMPKDNKTLFYETLNNWRKVPEDGLSAWDPANQAFMYADMASMNEFKGGIYIDPDHGIEMLSFSFMPFFRVGLNSEEKFVEAIKETSAILEASPLKDNAFIYGLIATYWEVFLELDTYVWILLGADAVIIFGATLLIFSFDVVIACATCVSCSMIVLEIYGLSCFIMNFNVFVAAISLMGMGFSVEFTAHLAAAFSLAEGPPTERLGTAMSHTFPAIFEGSISTILSILPMAFHPALFFVKYLFGIIALVVAVGLVNGLVVMPALVGIFSPLLHRLEHKKDLDALEAEGDVVGVDTPQLPTVLGADAGAVGGKSKTTIEPRL